MRTCLWMRLLVGLLVLSSLASSLAAGEYNKTLTVGDAAPAWENLEGTDGKKHSLADVKQPIVVVVFTCNSCPVAVAYEDRILAFAKKHGETVAVIAINVNTIKEDQLPEMKKRAEKRKFTFPYLYDPSQQIAKKFGANYTPEFFVLNADRKVVYMGALDDKSDASQASVNYLEDAIAAVRGGQKPKIGETLARGCKIRFEREKK